jgi:hypothetical protein
MTIKSKILLSKSKEREEIEISNEKELKKHLSIANRRRITGDSEHNPRRKID